jgi:hypothetical protein
MGVLGVVDTAPKGGDGDTEEGVTFPGCHFPYVVEITDTGGVKIEILVTFVVGHSVYSFGLISSGASATLTGRLPRQGW